jgi:TM2 domain-containing membrane protein YozV
MTSEISLMRGMSSEQRRIFESQMLARRKNPSTAVLLSVFGLGRFYLGQSGLGVIQWLLLPFLIGAIWMIIDIFTASQRTHDCNARLASSVAASVIASFPSPVHPLGTGQCSGCGTTIPSEAIFCTNCGAPVVSPVTKASSMEAATKKCPSCAEIIQKAAKKCRYCGDILTQETERV